jgi:hypothetical protein
MINLTINLMINLMNLFFVESVLKNKSLNWTFLLDKIKLIKLLFYF